MTNPVTNPVTDPVTDSVTDPFLFQATDFARLSTKTCPQTSAEGNFAGAVGNFDRCCGKLLMTGLGFITLCSDSPPPQGGDPDGAPKVAQEIVFKEGICLVF